MKFKDYISYMKSQHDEDPLYVFDDKPPFRWLIIGPERSGASWHVDPGLTSAWNTLLCGRKSGGLIFTHFLLTMISRWNALSCLEDDICSKWMVALLNLETTIALSSLVKIVIFASIFLRASSEVSHEKRGFLVEPRELANAEGGRGYSMHSLGTELEFKTILDKVKSPLMDHVQRL
ncbi:hypothetical protein HPP92_011200 [Vanilla planifolia]|uniref:JmjC domain-containing protein n=1 Tax=Vanilla planifolia TaxID=51239 RepID=A0A835R6M5_VANPL|nr:hypothetical protein HPP92_011200 [Vanilla planifolia]